MKLTCKRCGGVTNSVLSDHDYHGEEANFCYLRYENGEWVDGCAKKEETDPSVLIMVK